MISHLIGTYSGFIACQGNELSVVLNFAHVHKRNSSRIPSFSALESKLTDFDSPLIESTPNLARQYPHWAQNSHHILWVMGQFSSKHVKLRQYTVYNYYSSESNIFSFPIAYSYFFKCICSNSKQYLVLFFNSYWYIFKVWTRNLSLCYSSILIKTSLLDWRYSFRSKFFWKWQHEILSFLHECVYTP